MEPWEESLDVDDSDLHPLTVLRRCATTTTTTASQPQTLDSSPSPSQTVNTHPQTLTLASAQHPQSPSSSQSPPQSRTIPGPAGIVQAAKLRKSRDSVNPMATQEYIRKVVEDPEEDEDFKRNPWLSAVEFVHADGVFSSASNLGEINKCQRNGKLDQVVAVIKSCTPNGLGDMTVTLKDPTGTVSGTIHHKVLTEGDLRKGTCVGSVLILHKVSVFSPSRSTYYLNITKRNLVKVFYKDGGSSEKQTFQEAIDITPHYEDSELVTPTLGSAFYIERRTEGITSRMKRSNTNNEQETMSYTNTTDKYTNMEIARDNQPTINNHTQISRDKETLKEANVIVNVGQLNEGHTNVFGWTDEQIQELSDWDDI
ncbi:putative recombination protein [Helianthus annuus]|uniref:homologous recombination OB-fold protein n=1 Tax=Helianthus annuus TaxID=4232 RepID=UPI000B8F9BD0|nr:homologous recombination OB-fold protein [Helianthus annuus]KAJ0463018.1 putative recombination protein [Helianthus annuus]KAJ0484381.1 putative recombination protein [Helianthus annuus]KAJ0654933.1 putative recombination protein [Helianthus annuus]KAJ0658659.1 putative recombination protein [Helianthus annuus]KAJ0852146.1 putative recombination protein [Helianthus annuus]